MAPENSPRELTQKDSFRLSLPLSRAFWLACFTLSVAGAYAGVSVWRTGDRVRPSAKEGRVPPKSALTPFAEFDGKNLIVFVVASSDCGWSSKPAIIDAVASLRERIRSIHGGRYAHITVVGVVLDDSLNAGLRFLSKLGKGNPSAAFDQVVLGGSWLNEEIVRFVWREHTVPAASPQIIAVERQVNTDSFLSRSTISVQDDQIVANPHGNVEIVSWIRSAMPLSMLERHAGKIVPTG